jgi:hypothetical protein
MRYLIIFLLILFQSRSYSQSNLIETKTFKRNYTEYFMKIDNRFRWNNFSFDSSYSNYVKDLEELTDQEKVLFTDRYSTIMNDSNMVYRFKNNSEFLNIPFDNTFIRFGIDLNEQYYEELVFDRYLNDSVDANYFYNYYLFQLTSKLGEPKNWGTFSLWAGRAIYIKLHLTADNHLELEIGKYIKTNYFESLKFKYDYHCTAALFKEIDKNYSFRGIKFESQLEKLKQLAKLKPGNEETKSIFYTSEKKYKQWNQIFFERDTYFGFSSEKKLAEVNLFWRYNDEESFADFQDKIYKLLGHPSFISEDKSYWYGKKITIILDNIFSESFEGFTQLRISSNRIQRKKETFY